MSENSELDLETKIDDRKMRQIICQELTSEYNTYIVGFKDGKLSNSKLELKI